MTNNESGKVLTKKDGSNINKVKNYEDLFAQVTTVNVLTAEPTTPARIDPSIASFTTISGSTLPSHVTTFGTIKYPTEPIEKPSAQKIKIASPLDISRYP